MRLACSSPVALDLIDRIYDSALNSSEWHDFLRVFCQNTKAEQAAIFAHDLENRHYGVGAQYEIDPEYQRLYAEHYGDIDAWYTYGKDKLLTGVVEVGQELCTDQQLLKSEFFNDCLRRFDIFHQFGGQIEKSGSARAFITLLRSRRAGAFGPDETTILRKLMPHLQRAVRLHRRIVELGLRTDALERTLNCLTQAIILVGANGRVLFVNQAAEELVRRGDALLIQNDQLCGKTFSETARLKAAVNNAVRRIGSSSPYRIVEIRRSGHDEPLTVEIAPLVRRIGAGLPVAAAVVFINDPCRPDWSRETASRRFGLTQAEVRSQTSSSRATAYSNQPNNCESAKTPCALTYSIFFRRRTRDAKRSWYESC